MDKTAVICLAAAVLFGCPRQGTVGPAEPGEPAGPVGPADVAPQPPADVQETEAVWVEINPVQCMGNPWEQDWLLANDNDISAYPMGPDAPLPGPEEIEIIKDYYAKQDVEVLDARSAWVMQAVCEACSCPEGYTLYLSVAVSDVEKMTALGFKVSAEE